MSIVSAIEALVVSLRAKVGGLTAEAESQWSAFSAHAKIAETDAESKVSEEIAHLQSLGYTVTAPNSIVALAPAPVPTPIPVPQPIAAPVLIAATP